MSNSEEKPSLDDLEANIDSMVSVLESKAPPAPDLNKISKNEEKPWKTNVKLLLLELGLF